MFFFGPTNRCRPLVTACSECEDCGIRIVVATDTCCTRVCSQVDYAVTVTNNCNMEARCCVLRINVPQTNCVDPASIRIDGAHCPNADLACLELGNLAHGQTVTILYTATIMECQRFVRTNATLQCHVCCCCSPKALAFASNVNVVQVCCCCSCGNNERN